MSKIQMQWVNTGWHSFRMEVPQTRKAFEREENKRINHQVKQINRSQQQIRFRNFGKVR